MRLICPQKPPPVKLASDPVKKFDDKGWAAFEKIRSQERGWLPDFWKNSILKIYYRAQYGLNYYLSFPIIDNTHNTLKVGCKSEADGLYLKAALTSDYNYVRLDTGWKNISAGLLGIFPNMTEYFAIPLGFEKDFQPPDDLYYKLYVSEQNLPGNMASPYRAAYKGFNPYLDLDGNPAVDSRTKMLELSKEDLEGSSIKLPGDQNSSWLLRTPYKDGEPQKPKKGFFHLVVSTCDDTGFVGGKGKFSLAQATKKKNIVQSFYMMRPDIVELINISDKPISLRNWKVVINTGLYADQLGKIETARYYNNKGAYDDPNPIIKPNGYFYFTNYRDIFDREFGAPADGEWGNSAAEAYPVAEMPEALWGVRYNILGIKANKITVDGADWDKDQMKYEMIEWILKNPKKDQNSQFGLRSIIRGNSSDTLIAAEEGVTIVSVKPGDDILILGMPRQGGFLSMSLKNEYDQITARTITYGSTDYDEFNYSTEKLDPTHYNWKKTKNPSFGGSKNKALNHWQAQGAFVKPHVKNNRLSSIGEIQNIRKASDWENIGDNKVSNIDVLKSIAKYFTVAGVRLDPEEEGVHISGWNPAFAKSSFNSLNSAGAADVHWAPNMWAGHTLKVHSGAMTGEAFPIDKSVENAVSVIGYSVPSRKSLKLAKGDLFSVGPGYLSPMYYSTKSGEKGIWEWQNKGLEKKTYGLYLYGLNDSIVTTEFLEENNNPPIEVFVFNFSSNAYDRIPNFDDQISDVSGNPYNLVTNSKFHQYEKSDGVYCGLIHKNNISSSGGIKIKLIAHNIEGQDCSGMVWFDYIFLTPSTVHGKININTAPTRVLSSLKNISPSLALNIFTGTDRMHRKILKPYKNMAEVLDVDGMTPNIFRDICNLITTRGDQFRVVALSQTIFDFNHNGVYDKNDKILAQSSHEQIIDRKKLMNSGENK